MELDLITRALRRDKFFLGEKDQSQRDLKQEGDLLCEKSSIAHFEDGVVHVTRTGEWPLGAEHDPPGAQSARN